MRRKRRRLYDLIGLIFLLSAGCIFLLFYLHDSLEETKKTSSTPKDYGIAFAFEPEQLSYDGTGSLDLLSGVRATDTHGKDYTEHVKAILCPTASAATKEIRYTVFDDDGNSYSATRTLLLKNYQKPSISIPANIELPAEAFENFTAYLRDNNLCVCLDGFSHDVLGQMSWIRSRRAEGLYEIRMTMTNFLGDNAAASTIAHVSGELKDVTLTLTTTSYTMYQGESFQPDLLVASAVDPLWGDVTSRVTCTHNIKSDIPGTYEATYQVISVDGTNEVCETVIVTVLGKNQ